MPSLLSQRKHSIYYYRERGFTLIEVMIVLAIVAILAAVAFPSYQETMIKNRRADGKIALTEAAARLERFFTENNNYGTTLDNIGGSSGKLDSEEGYYSLSMANPCGNTSCFTLTATPQGAQTKDTKCGNLTLTHTGVPGGGASDCW